MRFWVKKLLKTMYNQLVTKVNSTEDRTTIKTDLINKSRYNIDEKSKKKILDFDVKNIWYYRFCEKG